MRRPGPVLFLLVVVLVAGCTSRPVFEGSFEDADLIIDGPSKPDAVGFLVPEGNVTLRVGIRYSIEATASIRAQVYPEGMKDEFVGLSLDGPASEHDPRWAVVRNATPGPWTFEGQVEGQGAYRAGIYFE